MPPGDAHRVGTAHDKPLKPVYFLPLVTARVRHSRESIISQQTRGETERLPAQGLPAQGLLGIGRAHLRVSAAFTPSALASHLSPAPSTHGFSILHFFAASGGPRSDLMGPTSQIAVACAASR